MDMRRIILRSLLTLFLLLQAGCQMVVVNSNRLEGTAGVSLISPNDLMSGSYWAKDIYNDSWKRSNQIDGDTE